MNVTRGLLPLTLMLVAAFGATAVAEQSSETEKPYVIECDEQGACTVDKATYVGWRTYHSNCHVCHAQDAVGSSFAPSLVDRMQDIDHERFITAVSEGYTGQIGVMPAWKDNPNVNKHFDALYAYLMARSDGVLAPGKPKRTKKK